MKALVRLCPITQLVGLIVRVCVTNGSQRIIELSL
jgi:hypothetical protein